MPAHALIPAPHCFFQKKIGKALADGPFRIEFARALTFAA